MGLYKKLPVTISAEEFIGFDEPIETEGVLGQAGISRYSMETKHCSICDKAFSKHGSVKTANGNSIVCPGDIMIHSEDGEFYPCKPDIFKSRYEEA